MKKKKSLRLITKYEILLICVGDIVTIECPYCGARIDFTYDQDCKEVSIKKFICWRCNKTFVYDFLLEDWI